MNGLVSINGAIAKAELAQISVLDRGFLFGDALYEIISAKSANLSDFTAHMNRLRSAAEQCRISIPWSDSELRFEIESLLLLTNFARSSIRLVISRGSGSGINSVKGLKPNRIILCSEVTLPSEVEYQKGLKLKIRSRQSNPRGELVKSPNYLEAIVENIQANENGFDDLLWSNSDADITETGTANIFLISRDGDLVEIATPPLNSGILAGVTRRRIIELLTRSNIPVTERSISVDEIPRFDEGFLTSSIRGPFPLSLIGHHKLHSTRPQAVFQHILRLYRSWEELEGHQDKEGDFN